MGRLAAGNLTEPLTLHGPATSVSDGRGGYRPGTAGADTPVYAAVRTLSGTEAIRLGLTVGSSVVEFTIRYKPEATSSTTVTWQGKSLGVRQVVHDPRKEFTVLTCVDNGRG